MSPNPKQFARVFAEEILGQLKPKLAADIAESEQIMPATILFNNDTDAVETIPMEMDGGASKDALGRHIRARAAAIGANSAIMITEAWTLPKQFSTPYWVEKLRRQYGGSIAADPADKRREIVQVSVEVIGATCMCIAEILPATDSAPRQLGAFEILEPTASYGRFSNFLRPL